MGQPNSPGPFRIKRQAHALSRRDNDFDPFRRFRDDLDRKRKERRPMDSKIQLETAPGVQGLPNSSCRSTTVSQHVKRDRVSQRSSFKWLAMTGPRGGLLSSAVSAILRVAFIWVCFGYQYAKLAIICTMIKELLLRYFDGTYVWVTTPTKANSAANENRCVARPHSSNDGKSWSDISKYTPRFDDDSWLDNDKICAVRPSPLTDGRKWDDVIRLEHMPRFNYSRPANNANNGDTENADAQRIDAGEVIHQPKVLHGVRIGPELNFESSLEEKRSPQTQDTSTQNKPKDRKVKKAKRKKTKSKQEEIKQNNIGQDQPGQDEIGQDEVEETRLRDEQFPLIDRKDFKRELRVPGSLDKIPVPAVPDLGSSFNIVSENFAQTNQLSVDLQQSGTFLLPDGRERSFIGTITAKWSFESDASTHEEIFYVLRDCIFPVLLGRPFLMKTETFTRFNRRVKEVLVQSTSMFQRLCFVDKFGSLPSSTERLLGLTNGRAVPGFTDSCSDISVIKRIVAQQLGLEILEGPEHITEVQFVDGSTSFTTGVVKGVEWCFGVTLAEGDKRHIDFHVMDDIPCAVILDKWLLWDNDAFNTYSDCFMSVEESRNLQQNPVCVLREVKKGKRQMATINFIDEEATWRAEEDDRIDSLPLKEQVAARAAEDRRRREWDEGHAAAILQPSLVPTSNTVSDSRPASSSTDQEQRLKVSTCSLTKSATNGELLDNPPASGDMGLSQRFQKLRVALKAKIRS